MSRFRLLPVAVLVFPSLAAAECTAPVAEQSDVVAGTGIEQVDLRANAGSVDVSASTDGRAHWTVRYCPKNGWFASSNERLAALRAAVEPSGRVLAIGTTLPSRVDDDDFTAHWTLALPPHVALDVGLGAGDVSITGLSGGIEIDAAAADVEVDVPGGELDIDLSVGDVNATWGPGDYADAAVDAEVGDAELRVGGHRIDVAKAPGPGHRIELEGERSGPSLIIDVSVGDASLTIR